MERNTCVLASIPNFGQVFDCGECGNIHLAVGPVTLTLAPEAYMDLVALLNTSASNFETWMQERMGANRPASHESASHLENTIHVDPNHHQDQA